MTGACTTRELERALLRKGFVHLRAAKHHRLGLVVDGKLTSLQTFVSRSSYDVGDGLAARMVFQLHMPDAKYLREFVSCPVSAEQYAQMLRDSGVL
jgi:hypothetical protein